jgi:hypothetical protein
MSNHTDKRSDWVEKWRADCVQTAVQFCYSVADDARAKAIARYGNTGAGNSEADEAYALTLRAMTETYLPVAVEIVGDVAAVIGKQAPCPEMETRKW